MICFSFCTVLIAMSESSLHFGAVGAMMGYAVEVSLLCDGELW